ncbi:MAG: hypothetical protein U9Q83_06800, partial [Bacteroidota bacterium]|nr:hypothetical protein [Bacteroidota bacterium]
VIMIDLSIIPECYIDTNLIETIVPPTKGYNHQKGAGTVTRLMQSKLSDKFAVGIVDRDKKQLKYVEEFDIKIDIGDLLLFKHKNPQKHHYLIFINPAMEKWIIKNANEVGISLQDYGLPSNLKELTKITKKITSKKDNTFKKLFRELTKRNPKNVEILANWIKHLKENPYNVDIDKMQKMT